MFVPLPCPIPNQCCGTGLQGMGQFKALSPGGIHYLTSLKYHCMKTQEKIKAAQQRIKELKILIELWTNKKVNTKIL